MLIYSFGFNRAINQRNREESNKRVENAMKVRAYITQFCLIYF